jgi:hypothetical protein
MHLTKHTWSDFLTEMNVKTDFSLIGMGEPICYIDGSKPKKDADAGVSGYGAKKRLSFSLGQYTTIFQFLPLRHIQSRI